MNDSPERDKLVEQQAKEHGLDAERFHDALVEALDAYDDEDSLWEWREEAYSHRRDVARVLKATKRAADKWASLPPIARDEVRRFQGPGGKDPVVPRLKFIVDLLEEYYRHYSKTSGRPRVALDKDHARLEPLEAFTVVLMNHWIAEKNEPFGHVLEEDYQRTDSDPDRGDRVPKSSAMKFLSSCAVLLPHTYSASSLETVVRRIKRS